MMIVAPAIASTARTITQKYQYSQPATKPAPGAERGARVLDERARRRPRDRHLAEHAHREDHEHAGDRVRDHRGRAGLL